MSLHLQIVTPKGSVVTVEAEEVILPGKLGEFGVLEGHIPFLSALKPGVVKYKTADEWHRLAVGGGFAEVGANEKVLVLVENHALPDQIDLNAVQKERAELAAQLMSWSGELTADHQILLEKSAWAQARIEAKGKDGL